MRIALVSEVFLPAVDGVVTRLMRTLEQLRAAGDETLMIAPAGGETSYAGVPVVGMRGLPVPLYPDGDGYPPKRVALPGRELGRTLRAYRPDVIHVVQPILLGVGAVAFARRHRIPLVASYHAHLATYARLYRLGWLEPATWAYLRSLHNCAAVNLGTSMATVELLRAHGVQRLALWPWGVDRERFHPGQAREEWRRRLSGGRPESLVLLYVGRLAREKTVERLHGALRAGPDVTLAIVGDGPLRGELARTFAGTPTTFMGMLHGDDLAHSYASADVLVLPSDTETLGMVVLEAHAAGLPVIAADSPAARELVRDGIDGVRYDPARPDALAGAVARLADPGRRREMSTAAVAAGGHATWRGATDVLRSHYRRAIDPGAEARPDVTGRPDGPVDRAVRAAGERPADVTP